MIVLDASVLIGFMFDQDAHHDAAVTLLRHASQEPFGASPITLAQALVTPTRLGQVALAELMLQDLGVTEVPLPIDAAVRLAQLRVESTLTMPDCCVLLAALSAKAAIATFDDRLAKVAIARRIPIVTS